MSPSKAFLGSLRILSLVILYHFVSIKRNDDSFMNLKCLNIPLALLVKVFQVLYSKVDVCDFVSPPFLEQMP